MTKRLKVVSEYSLAGDQPKAVDALVEGVNNGLKDQVLLGVTGSGKTFSMAHIIERTQKPALILAHNKTLAAQLYSEMKLFFPDNAVEYFVSYYDYYQPEAYIPSRDVYIEKDSQINERIDLLRHSATRSLLERRDVIVVASISCIYGLGSPEWYIKMILQLEKGQKIARNFIVKNLIELQYKRNDIDFKRGTFRVKGDTLDIFPSHYQDRAWRLSFWGDDLENLFEFDPLTGEKIAALDKITIFANSHYITPRPTLEQSLKFIKEELRHRAEWFRKHDKLIEVQRIEQRTLFDLEMIMEAGACKGIENYSRYLSGRNAGEPPPTLFEYLPKDALFFVDESHVSVPQIGGMYNGDRSRKQTLVEYGFRLPSALDNRPLKFEEWEQMRPQTIFVSATPGPFELKATNGSYVEQIIRPTGLIDPECIVRPASTQVDDLLNECKQVVAKGNKILVTTLTKKMAEDLSGYLKEIGIKAVYLHSDIDTLERIEIIRDLRKGIYDVLVGVNLLREGLDIPECGLVAILDADKEGFLRSKTSLIQTIGRAARNVDGKVVLYADVITNSIREALSETERRRKLQTAYNKKHGITPASIKKTIHDVLGSIYEQDRVTIDTQQEEIDIDSKNVVKALEKLRREMKKHAAELDFEKAAELRDKIKDIEEKYMHIKQ